MQESLTDEKIKEMAAEWLPSSSPLGRIHRDTSDFFKVEYGDVVVLGRRAFLVGHNAKEGRFGSETIVVGRKGVSRKEELLFGSVSNRIIHQAEDCTVWVVE